jgi:prolyl-tRNA editing enzyme YbaK/EbsC (Cys-tRNA(Pro) deacylase)
MADQLHPNAARVQAALEAAGSQAQVVELDGSTRTAEEAAATLGVEVAQIVKSLVFVADGEPVLMLVPGDRRVDTAKAKAALEAAHFARADADVVRAATGYPIGGVPPLGHATVMRTLLDTGLGRHEVLWAAAGTPRAVFPTTEEELLTLTGGAAADLT